MNLTVDPQLQEQLVAGRDAGSFLSTGSMDTYRRDNYLTKVFNKRGTTQANTAEYANLTYQFMQALEDRFAACQLPERSAAQR